MRIAYLTTEEVHQELARRIAEAYGVTLVTPLLRDAPVSAAAGLWARVYAQSFPNASPEGPFDAVLIDWDWLPLPLRQEVLADLLCGPLPCPVALHGPKLGEADVEALRRNGVTVCPRLGPEVVRGLRHTAGRPVRRTQCAFS